LELVGGILGTDPGSLDDEERESYLITAEAVTQQQHFFHWELEFPEIWREKNGKAKMNGGFKAIVGNPPWDKIKGQDSEFIEQFDPIYRALTSQQKAEVFEHLLENENIRCLYLSYYSVRDSASNYFDFSGIYQHQSAKVYGRTVTSDKNAYKLFVEQFAKLTRSKGRFAFITPGSIATDLGCTGLRRLLLETAEPLGIWGFYKRAKMFDIDQAATVMLFKKNKPSGAPFVSVDQIGFDTPGDKAAILEELKHKIATAPKTTFDFLQRLSLGLTSTLTIA
jgi:hypothetical protein